MHHHSWGYYVVLVFGSHVRLTCSVGYYHETLDAWRWSVDNPDEECIGIAPYLRLVASYAWHFGCQLESKYHGMGGERYIVWRWR